VAVSQNSEALAPLLVVTRFGTLAEVAADTISY